MKWLTRLLSNVDYDNITDEVTLTLTHREILCQKKVLRILYENYYRRHLSLLATGWTKLLKNLADSLQ
jgi:hypothetical protein